MSLVFFEDLSVAMEMKPYWLASANIELSLPAIHLFYTPVAATKIYSEALEKCLLSVFFVTAQWLFLINC